MRLTGAVLDRATVELSQMGVGFDLIGRLMTERPRLGLNSYTYVLNDPLRWSDPTGLLNPGEGKGGGDGSPENLWCPLVAKALIGIVPLPPGLTRELTVWYCVYDCNRTCPGTVDNLITEIQWDVRPHSGCYPRIRRPRGK